MNKILNFIWVVLVVLFFVWIIFSLCGCYCSTQIPPTQPITPGTNIIWNTIKSTDWLMSIFLIAIVGGIFAGINGFKAGWAGAFSAFVGMLLKAALSVTWVYLAAGFILIGCILLFVVSVLIKNKALTEIVKGVQIAKDKMIVGVGGESLAKKVLVEALKEQTKSTQKIVQQIKGDLKVKGELL